MTASWRTKAARCDQQTWQTIKPTNKPHKKEKGYAVPVQVKNFYTTALLGVSLKATILIGFVVASTKTLLKTTGALRSLQGLVVASSKNIRSFEITPRLHGRLYYEQQELWDHSEASWSPLLQTMGALRSPQGFRVASTTNNGSLMIAPGLLGHH